MEANWGEHDLRKRRKDGCLTSYSMRLKQHILVGACILITGALPYLYTVCRYKQHNWTPLTIPVVLKPGIIKSPYFRTDLNGTYLLSLVFDTMPDLRREDCLIGDDFPTGSCKGVQRTLYFAWKVVRGSAQIIGSGQYNHAWSSGSGDVEAGIGGFEGKRGDWQKIILNVARDASELNAAHPRLQVAAHGSYWEKWIIYGQFAFLLMIGVCLPALIWTVWPLVFHRRKPV
jgi:hypothetical protein